MKHLESYETFDERQTKLLEQFVTNTTSHVFVLRNLPEVIKGALFSRYSRSKLGLRSLLLKEFVHNQEDAAFGEIVGESSGGSGQALAIQRAQDFYDRILDGYGDDSIGELGGAHLAIENISMIAAKVIEDCRIGGSPLEKSTRYIYFDQKHEGEYLYYREPVLLTSQHRERYLATCDMLFDTYSKLIPPMMERIQEGFALTEGTSKVAYNAALRAKVLDCLRGLLPASALTNMGVFGNGRFFEGVLRRLQQSALGELQDIAVRSGEELGKVIPSFVRRVNPTHRHYAAYAKFEEEMSKGLRDFAAACEIEERVQEGASVRLVDYDPDGKAKVGAALLFPHANKSLEALEHHVRALPPDQLRDLFTAACTYRGNRRHKSPRALERATFTFEIVADFGCYRDLQRHRMLTQDRQLLTCNHGYYVPPEIVGTPMEKEYRRALTQAAEVYHLIAPEFPEEAQYVVPMAYNIRWYFHINLRALQWLTELRSSPQGHPAYRLVAQQLAQETTRAVPEFAPFLGFVDYDGYDLGRLDQEQRQAERKASSCR